MKARIQIPKGWRRVPTGRNLQKGDAVLMRASMHWMIMQEIIANASPARPNETVIRRIKRKAGK